MKICQDCGKPNTQQRSQCVRCGADLFGQPRPGGQQEDASFQIRRRAPRSGSKAAEAIGPLVGLLVTAAFFVGIFHGFIKHGAVAGIGASVFPPYALYLGVETLWHDDFEGVDWKLRIDNDLRTVTSLMAAAPQVDAANTGTFGEAIEELAAKVATYPEDRRNTLKRYSSLYAQYQISIGQDLGIAFDRMVRTAHPFEPELSAATVEIERQLLQQPVFVSIVKSQREGALQGFETAGIDFSELSPAQIARVSEIFHANIDRIGQEAGRVHSSVFKERVPDLEPSSRTAPGPH